jgi:hypothetical protein
VSNTLRSCPDNILFQNINYILGGQRNLWKRSKCKSKITEQSKGGKQTLDDRIIKVESTEQSFSDGKLEILSFNQDIRAGLLSKILGKKANRIAQSKFSQFSKI